MIKVIKRFILYVWYVVFGACFRLLPIQKNKIVCSNFLGKGYGENPKYLAEELLKRNSFEVIWLIRGNNVSNLPKEVKAIKIHSLLELYHLSTAGIWIDDCRKDFWIRKRKNQYYIQTWHANIMGKRVEADAEDKLSKEYVRNAKYDSKIADLFLSGSKWLSERYREAFWYNGEILEYGLPRSDIFYKNPDEYREKVYKNYQLDSDVKLALYAPTFRVDGNLNCYDLDYQQLLNDLQEKWGGKWKIVVRLHPNIQSLQNEICYGEDILNGSKYGDINELIIASDLLITDYSSCMFDAMEAGKKVLLYATDMEAYMADRGTYFSFEELPFLLAENKESLYQNIKIFDEEVYKNKADAFMKQCGFCNCKNSAEKIVDYIIEQVKDK